jgi:hypothetical protein
VVVILIAPIHGSAWGDIGHRIVARIASRYLNPQARTTIVDLLRIDSKLNPSYYSGSCPDVLQLANKTVLTNAEAATFTERGLACIASWADPPLKKDRKYTSNWHFVDIPVNLRGPNGPVLSSFQVARECRMNDKYGDCAFLALKRTRADCDEPDRTCGLSRRSTEVHCPHHRRPAPATALHHR